MTTSDSNPPEYGASPGSSASEPQPVCHRHPDRVSYVRCKNCGRPACGECQQPTEVGVLCADCVHQNQGARTTRRSDTPWVTYCLMGLCVVVYILQWVTVAQPQGVTQLFQYAGVYTSAVALEYPWLPFEPWRMITSAFVHSLANPVHLLMNMLVLYMMGRALEPALGRVRFLGLYLLSAFGGSVAVLFLSEPHVPVVGASGAVYGLFAAMFILLRQSGGQLASITALIVLNLVISFVGSNISWQGHIGGLITGGLTAGLMLGLHQLFSKRMADPTLPNVSGGLSATAVAQLGTWLAIAAVFVVLVVLTWVGALSITL
ncbi:rhomboid family intramembrane serine protease [Auritidibacter ignavus]|uniref:rhomboid family intramembrane serine protease n=1 Tax=Auritidibacter TaxID=1160973 RepID=UPI001F38BD87|nr:MULTISPECIES: rhomboid family intramembrane serine protease [Auritidibacter]WGH80944.1 rhomboid family intramembrane serine protease [Auritidibacter ignavus]WGH85548.1 rhomboid family intramembrane serine protease [Auritidibacter ignavus]WGH87836.1 rhomboid family intramembrane serine protease [Auritidibacter ignavus]WGH90142.1 rhomboid family intramembrane serine protease [Auritidibacter ignavus]